jgi:hypothetical protein
MPVPPPLVEIGVAGDWVVLPGGRVRFPGLGITCCPGENVCSCQSERDEPPWEKCGHLGMAGIVLALSETGVWRPNEAEMKCLADALMGSKYTIDEGIAWSVGLLPSTCVVNITLGSEALSALLQIVAQCRRCRVWKRLFDMSEDSGNEVCLECVR